MKRVLLEKDIPLRGISSRFRTFFFGLGVLVLIVAGAAACQTLVPAGSSGLSGGSGASDGRPLTPGNAIPAAGFAGTIIPCKAGNIVFNMVAAADTVPMYIPFSASILTDGVSDDAVHEINERFMIAQTEMTNELAQVILQWALDNNKLTVTAGAHNSVDVKFVRYGGQVLLKFDIPGERLFFNVQSGKFETSASFEKHPLVGVSWYGAIMLCNWLTEMTDGPGNVVYDGITTAWNQAATKVIAGRKGYRLPTNAEWDFAARFLGKKAPTEGDLAARYLAPGKNHGADVLTPGYFWTSGNYASGALADVNNADATAAVAAYEGTSYYHDWSKGPMPTRTFPVASRKPNQLGLYDMSGNVREWCFDLYTAGKDLRIVRGSTWLVRNTEMRLGKYDPMKVTNVDTAQGFRLVRSR